MADKNPNAADDNEQIFNYRWPKSIRTKETFLIIFFAAPLTRTTLHDFL